MVLESRHLIGIFLLLVVIFGVVFTLGYLLGRSQYDAQLRATAQALPARSGSEEAPLKPSESAAETRPGANAVTPPSSDWDYYKAPEPKAKVTELKPTAKNAGGRSSSRTASKDASGKAGGLLNAPLIPRGAIVLQVAALTREGDALALAQALQQKRFPAFVLTPKGDSYYRVQVGPYADMQSANLARQKLESQGFKSIIKR